jgi:hypothetical protein
MSANITVACRRSLSLAAPGASLSIVSRLYSLAQLAHHALDAYSNGPRPIRHQHHPVRFSKVADLALGRTRRSHVFFSGQRAGDPGDHASDHRTGDQIDGHSSTAAAGCRQ